MRTLLVLAGLILPTSCGAAGSSSNAETAIERSPPAASEVAALATALSLTTEALDAAEEARRAASLSVGTAAHGTLPKGVELPIEGPHHSVIDRLRKYGMRWGTGELVRLILDVSEHVHRTTGGAPLRVGELSKKGGGDLRWHRSHNSGRDVDLAFYVVDAKSGESVPAPRQLHFNGRGRSSQRKDLRFDVVRNWRLVERLLTQDEAPVQWVFVSRPLKALLLEHARSVDADPEVVQKAEVVLAQPSSASPHENHFHVRILCSAEDVLKGCTDAGPRTVSALTRVSRTE